MSTYHTHHASTSRPAPSLSINTARSNTRSTSPTKGPIPKLYQLPPALESPGPSNPTRRARPGGLAGMSSDVSDTRSFMSDRPGPGRRMSDSTARRGSDFTLPQGVGEGWMPTSPTREHDPGPSQEVRPSAHSPVDSSNFRHSLTIVAPSISLPHPRPNLLHTSRPPSLQSLHRIVPCTPNCSLPSEPWRISTIFAFEYPRSMRCSHQPTRPDRSVQHLDHCWTATPLRPNDETSYIRSSRPGVLGPVPEGWNHSS